MWHDSCKWFTQSCDEVSPNKSVFFLFEYCDEEILEDVKIIHTPAIEADCITLCEEVSIYLEW